MKAAGLTVAGVLLGSIALLPFASADGGLVVMLFVSPEGQGLGESINIDVQTYRWSQLTDMDTVTVSVSYGVIAGNATRVGLGTYRFSHTIDERDARYYGLSIEVRAQLGTARASADAPYLVRGAGGASLGWQVTARLLAPLASGLTVAPGTSVMIEARSYLDGVQMDGGPINATIATQDGFSYTTEPLAGSKVAEGLFRFPFTVPANLTETRSYVATVSLGSPYDSVSGTLSISETASFSSNPVPMVSSILEANSSSVTVRVLVGGAAPIAGANVQLVGVSYITFPPYGMSATFNGTTDARGEARVTADLGSTPYVSAWLLNVSAGGKTTSTSFFYSLPSPPPPFRPDIAYGFGCELLRAVDATAFFPGDTAHLKFVVYHNGSPVASQSVARFVVESNALTVSQASNITTDAEGTFTLTYVVPLTLRAGGGITVGVLCPTGEYDGKSLTFGDRSGSAGSPFVTLSASETQRGVQVTTAYTGSGPLDGAEAIAIVAPGNRTGFTSSAAIGDPPRAVLARSGNTFSGEVEVPSWLPDGDYLVVVLITNRGATASLSEQFSEFRIATVHLSPATGGGNGPGGSGGGGILGQSPALTLLILVAAAGAGVSGFVVMRRRRRSESWAPVAEPIAPSTPVAPPATPPWPSHPPPGPPQPPWR